MKKSFIKFLGAVALVAGLASSASAAYIVGSLGYTGVYSVSSPAPFNGDLTTATALSSTGGFVLFRDGDFSTIPLFAPVAVASPFAVNPPSQPINALWSVGGFTFDLATISQTVSNPTQLGFVGTGSISSAGFDTTAGTWQMTFGRSGSAFTFQATSTSVPEGGAAIALLGLGLLGLEGARRRLKA